MLLGVRTSATSGTFDFKRGRRDKSCLPAEVFVRVDESSITQLSLFNSALMLLLLLLHEEEEGWARVQRVRVTTKPIADAFSIVGADG